VYFDWFGCSEKVIKRSSWRTSPSACGFPFTKRKQKRPRLIGRDQWFWIALSVLWKEWRRVLCIVHPDTVVRWQREARTISSLNHPHICHLYDIGSQEGTDFLVMEFLDGETLAERLRKGKLEAPKHLARSVHDLYFEPKYEEFQPRTIWSLSNAFTSAFKELDPIPQFKATAKLGEFLETRFSQSF
jgi:serine/threonine protein kinase